MDPCDIGSRETAFRFAVSMRQHRAEMEAQAAQETATECDECGEEIPKGRRDAEPGCRLCVACKTKHEKGLI